jgi:hypothetical protein
MGPPVFYAKHRRPTPLGLVFYGINPGNNPKGVAGVYGRTISHTTKRPPILIWLVYPVFYAEHRRLGGYI